MERESRFSVGEVLSQSFSIWGKNFIPFTVLVVIVHSPVLLYAMLFLMGTHNAQEVYWFGIVTGLGNLLLSYVATGAVLFGVLQQLRGTRPSIGESIAVGLRRLLPVLGVAITMSLLVFLAFLALFVPGIIVSCMLWVAIPVAVVERAGIRGALGRSRMLTKGHRGEIFGLLLVLGVFMVLVGVLVGFLFPSELISQLLSTVLSTLTSVAAAVSYHRLRAAKEGIGIEELAAVFD